LRLLLDATPRSANHDNNDEKTAIEYAIINLVDMRVVKMLQKVCIRNCLQLEITAMASRESPTSFQYHGGVEQLLCIQVEAGLGIRGRGK